MAARGPVSAIQIGIDARRRTDLGIEREPRRVHAGGERYAREIRGRLRRIDQLALIGGCGIRRAHSYEAKRSDRVAVDEPHRAFRDDAGEDECAERDRDAHRREPEHASHGSRRSTGGALPTTSWPKSRRSARAEERGVAHRDATRNRAGRPVPTLPGAGRAAVAYRAVVASRSGRRTCNLLLTATSGIRSDPFSAAR